MALRAFSTLPNRPRQKRSSFAAQKNLLMANPRISNPSTTCGTNPTLQAQFRSSSSQTTFLDRNIVQNLAVTASAPLTASSSKISSIGRSSTTTTACGTMQVVSGSSHHREKQQSSFCRNASELIAHISLMPNATVNSHDVVEKEGISVFLME